MDVREKLEERIRHSRTEREVRKEAEEGIAEQLEEAGFRVEEVDVVSDTPEFDAVLSQMLSRKAFASELDAVFDEFECTGVQAVDDRRIRVFFGPCDREP